jgi:hypothetical protein
MTLNQIKNRIKDIVVDIYYENERDGEPLSLKTVWLLIGTNDWRANDYITTIIDKLKQKPQLSPF